MSYRERSSSSNSIQKLKDYFDDKFDSITREAKSPQKQEKAFNKNSCKIQFEFNQKQLRLVKDAIKLMESGAVNRPLEKLEEVKKNLKKRNKLIKIADKSQFGWATVKEYETDSVASNSEDEKKIKKAEKRAAEKQSSSKPVKKFRKESSTLSRNPESSSGRIVYSRSKPTDKCLACGKPGHWRYECPEKRSSYRSYDKEYHHHKSRHN